MSRLALLLTAASVPLGCARDPQPKICPELQTGDLVITEIRGGSDSYGQWIELYNASGQTLELRGLRLRIEGLDGALIADILVRPGALEVAAEAYVVLGHHDPEQLPEYVDYSFFSDFSSQPASSEDTGEVPEVSTAEDLKPRDLPRSALLEVEGCQGVVDRLVYRALPEEGSWAFDGRETPDAEANDDPSLWCNDLHVPPGPQTQVGLPGTPQKANEACPEADT